MSNRITPTKANLIKSKNSFIFSEKGYELLDKKRTVLIQEMMTLIDYAKEIEKEIEKKFAEAYEALMHTTITMGVRKLEEVVYGVNDEKEYKIRFKSVMGVEIPELIYSKEEKVQAQYGFYHSNPSLDVTMYKFKEVQYLCYELAQLETAAYKLSLEIKKTQKRANALNKIQIPKLVSYIKFIEDTLEEKDREDFFRLKAIKKKRS